VRKQEQLDATICENYALQARLRSAEERSQSFEKQLVEARAAAGGMYDMETGGMPMMFVNASDDNTNPSILVSLPFC